MLALELKKGLTNRWNNSVFFSGERIDQGNEKQPGESLLSQSTYLYNDNERLLDLTSCQNSKVLNNSWTLSRLDFQLSGVKKHPVFYRVFLIIYLNGTS